MKTKVFEVKSHQQQEGGKTLHTVTKVIGEVPDKPGEVQNTHNRQTVEVYRGYSQFEADQARDAANNEMYA